MSNYSHIGRPIGAVRSSVDIRIIERLETRIADLERELDAARAVVEAANGILRGDLNGYAKLGSVLDTYDRVRGAE